MTLIYKTWILPETNYSSAQILTPLVTESTLGILKMRFRCIDKSSNTLQYCPLKVCKIFLACCILHNTAIKCRLSFKGEAEINESNENDELNEPDKTHLQNQLAKSSIETRNIRARLLKHNFKKSGNAYKHTLSHYSILIIFFPCQIPNAKTLQALFCKQYLRQEKTN